MTLQTMREVEQIISCMVYLLNTGCIQEHMEPEGVSLSGDFSMYTVDFGGKKSVIFDLPVANIITGSVIKALRLENIYNLADMQALFKIAVSRFVANNPIVTIGVLADLNTPIPVYGTERAGAVDIHSNVDTIVAPGEKVLIKTDLKLEIPRGYEIDVRPRSGLANKNMVTVLNTPGLVDEDYKGEIGVILINHGTEPFRVNIGDRVAQMSVKRTVRANFVRTNTLTASSRGDGGFGHTGK